MDNNSQDTGRIDFRRHKRLITVMAFIILFAGGIAGGYFFLHKTSPKGREARRAEGIGPAGSVTEVQVYFPSEGRLKAESRSVPRALSKRAAARATVEEFLKGPTSGIKSLVPQNARVLGIYDGADGVLYIDLSDEFRRNLQVDAISEFLLLRGLYESVLANVYGVADVKILIEGAEVETLGGHVSLIKPLGDTVSQTLVEE
jgi:hypothetical protein